MRQTMQEAEQPAQHAAQLVRQQTFPLTLDVPDPTVLNTPQGYYVYSTNTDHVNVPVRFSLDLRDFELIGDAMPDLPAWASGGFTWAPEVSRAVDGQYRLYFTARLAGTAFQVIGVASADRPEGPFIATDTPLVTMLDLGGAIDPAVLIGDQGDFLYWKNDGNAVGLPTTLWGAPLGEDGLSGTPVALLGATELWEHDLVEAPQVIEENGLYHLLYSCADFGNESYAVGHACGEHPLGPFQKDCACPLLASSGNVAGPGHSHAFRDASGDWRLAYHAWSAGQCGYPHGSRALHISPLHLSGRHARVN